MSKGLWSAALVRSIIGDIPVAFDPEDIGEIETLTDDEVAEIEALPAYEMTPEQQASADRFGKEFVQYAHYSFSKKWLGLVPLDWHEWRNMNPKPTAQEVV